jgi:deoxyribose-phosphate aldolase
MDLRSVLEHTLLKPDATETEVLRTADEAIERRLFGVCVSPCWVERLRAHLDGAPGARPRPRLVTVAGFPHGTATTAAKVADAIACARAGAEEIDMVANVGFLRSGNDNAFGVDIAAVAAAARSERGAAVKVILETALLDDTEIARACLIAEAAGAAFVKTSTGYAARGASRRDIEIMARAVGGRLGIKASGGIRTRDAALDLLAAGATRIGASASLQMIDR